MKSRQMAAILSKTIENTAITSGFQMFEIIAKARPSYNQTNLLGSYAPHYLYSFLIFVLLFRLHLEGWTSQQPFKSCLASLG